jgi:peptide deformylase
MIRPLVRFGASGLAVPAARVEVFGEQIDALIRDMTDTVYAAPGVGLAAPQIGVPLRVCVIDLSVGKQPGALQVLINPEFVERAGMQVEDEGCLSVPGFTASVPRPARAVVRAFDRHGRPFTVEGTGLLARALQHEVDHLDGMLFLERLRRVRRNLIVRKIKKLEKRGLW